MFEICKLQVRALAVCNSSTHKSSLYILVWRSYKPWRRWRTSYNQQCVRTRNHYPSFWKC